MSCFAYSLVAWFLWCSSILVFSTKHSQQKTQKTVHHKHESHNVGSTTTSRAILDLKMPGAHPRKAEEYLCTPSKRLSSKTSYIVKYEPHAESSTAHHILLIGCKYPAHHSKLWQCGGDVCRGEEHIIYAWAKNAKALTMPKGVGFAVGGKTGINYIVMQVHYARALKGNERDYSGIKIHMTHSRVKHLAEIYMLGAGETRIPPRSIGFHADIACRYKRPYDMVPFAFRTHAHSTARVISGYRVRNGKWTLIGIGNPQLPQVFYPIPAEKQLKIHRGDILAGRCTYDTPHRNRFTYMGATSKDEMCNFYMMYYKVYKEGKFESHRVRDRFPSDCMDIEPGISKHDLKFPADSDELPVSMKANGTMGHHHHHHHSMAGDAVDLFDNHDKDDDDDDDNDGSDGDGFENAGTREEDSDEDRDRLFTDFDSEDQDRNLEDRLGGDKQPEENVDSWGTDEPLTDDKEDNQVAPQRKERQHKEKSSGQSNAVKGKMHDSMESDLDSLVSSKNDKQKEAKVPKEIKAPTVDGDWPYQRDELKKIGQVSAVGMSKNHLLLLHRADRPWIDGVFDSHNRLTHKYRTKKISSATVLHLDPKTGAVKKRWGKNMFYLPHGLTVDKHNNVWITDVGAHQVYKFSPNDFSKPILTLGIALKPGSDTDHFCQPADVAVASNGDFYVADGYCNSRIMKFSPKGKLIKRWGRSNKGHGSPGPFEFDIPHSLALDEDNKLLYVADRENGRIQCFDTNGKFKKIIHHKEFGGRLFAVSFTPFNGGLLYAVSGPSLLRHGPRASGFTVDPKTKEILNKWSPFSRGFSRPHDLQATTNNTAVFVAEIGPNRVWRFNIPQKEKPVIDGSKINDEDRRSDEEISKEDAKTNENKEQKPSSGKKSHTEPHHRNGSSPYKTVKPEDDTNIIPAIVVVVVLATPIALICAAATIQHLRFKHKREKALRKRTEDAFSSKPDGGCFGCCRTKKYYYDNKRGFDKLIGEDDTEECEDDYFVRKGAI